MSEELFDDVEQSEYAEEMDQIQLVGVKLGDEEYAIDVLKINGIIHTWCYEPSWQGSSCY